MRSQVISIAILFLQLPAMAQSVGVGTTSPNTSAVLDVSSNNKGLLVPRINLVSLVDAGTIASPATGLLVFNTNAALPAGTGFYFNSGTPATPAWLKLQAAGSGGSNWTLGGNSGIDSATQFLGTTDMKPLIFKVNNQFAGKIGNDGNLGLGIGALKNSSSNFNVALGDSSQFSSVNGVHNTAVGYNSLRSNIDGNWNVALGALTLDSLTAGNYNVAIGISAQRSNRTGSSNVAVGSTSLYSNIDGTGNIAIGGSTLQQNTKGDYNIAIGSAALNENTTANHNIAIGRNALRNQNYNFGGAPWESDNLAIGTEALYNNNPSSSQTGARNLAIGNYSMRANTTGAFNMAVGAYSLQDNTTGNYNTSIGYGSMYENTTGFGNTVLGYNALYGNNTGDNNIALGRNAAASNSIANRNIAIGTDALSANSTASDNIAIGDRALRLQAFTNAGLPWAANNIAIGTEALYNNRPDGTLGGLRNIAIGVRSLTENTIGRNNTAVGDEALRDNITGLANSAFGAAALSKNTIGSNNAAFGSNALLNNTSGNSNVAMGSPSLSFNTSGLYNVAIGAGALNANTTGDYNTGVGYVAGDANDNSFYCTYIGYDANQATTTDYSNSTAIGRGARITGSNQVRLGNSSVTSIGGYEAWSNLSDGRFKLNVQENIPGLAFIKALRPVSYSLDVAKLSTHLHENTSGTEAAIAERSRVIQTGFIAQEVEAAAGKLGYDFSGVDKPKNADDLYALRYASFVVPLVKAVQELSARVEALEQENKQLKNTADLNPLLIQLQEQLNKQKAEIDELKKVK